MSVSIGFSYPKQFKLASWIISKWIQRPYSHVYLKFKSDKIQDTVYQAAYGSVHFMSNSRFLSKNNVVSEVELVVTPELKRSMLINAVELASEPYGYIEILKIVMADLFKIKSYNGKGYICSELLGHFLTQYYGITFAKPLHLLTPRDIEEAINGKT